MTSKPNIMQDAQAGPADGFRLVSRARSLRGDERGSLTLLAGMMVFLVTIFGIIAFDTNMAIYNRIVAQNAVDSAADSAALWQARGCNLLQQLNNLHYDVDIAACIAEGVAATACIASAALLVAELAADVFFGAGESLRPARMVTCLVCDTLPWIDYAQQLFYKAIMPIEQAIVDVTPYIAFGYANACAQGSGADRLGDALSGGIQGLLSALGINSSGLDSIGGAVSSILGAIPIYAIPLDLSDFGLFDPENKGLYVKKKDNDGSPPLKWPEAVGEAGDIAGLIGCEDADYPYADSKDEADSAGWDGTWGWDDQYYFGHPGYSTWIAGKAQRPELLALGNLRWLNGGSPPTEVEYAFNQQNLPMYTGSATGGGTALQIPGFIAIASSQVEGTPVICHGDVDAAGKLIKVYIPLGSSPTAGEDLFIYH